MLFVVVAWSSYRYFWPGEHPSKLQSAVAARNGLVLAVAVERGACDDVTQKHLDEGSREVRITIEVRPHRGRCIAMLLYDYVAFDLSSPLGDRAVIDASRDHRLPVRTATVADIVRLTGTK